MQPPDRDVCKEGLQIMHTLGKNMAWLLQCIEAGKKAGVQEPAAELSEDLMEYIEP